MISKSCLYLRSYNKVAFNHLIWKLEFVEIAQGLGWQLNLICFRQGPYSFGIETMAV